jgi:hypothetical protein
MAPAHQPSTPASPSANQTLVSTPTALTRLRTASLVTRTTCASAIPASTSRARKRFACPRRAPHLAEEEVVLHPAEEKAVVLHPAEEEVAQLPLPLDLAMLLPVLFSQM